MYYYYHVAWAPVGQNMQKYDYFCNRETAQAVWGKFAHEMSYVHISENPQQAVRDFLKELPLHRVTITYDTYLISQK